MAAHAFGGGARGRGRDLARRRGRHDLKRITRFLRRHSFVSQLRIRLLLLLFGGLVLVAIVGLIWSPVGRQVVVIAEHLVGVGRWRARTLLQSVVRTLAVFAIDVDGCRAGGPVWRRVRLVLLARVLTSSDVGRRRVLELVLPLRAGTLRLEGGLHA